MVGIEGLPYPVTIEPGIFGRLPEIVRSLTPRNRVVMVTDRTVGDIVGIRQPSLAGRLDGILRGPFTERTKTRESWAKLTDWLLEMQAGRDTTIVAVGGGVIGDLAGFVAATYMRGIPYVQVPTSLLAMVDASIGGKTGVDTGHGKNLVGAFHQPAAVLIDPLVLETLPAEHLRAGFAEIIKHGVVADAHYLARAREFVERWPLRWDQGADVAELTAIIRRSVEIKASVVARDEREGGERKILNFGHTIGHAIETVSEYSMLHGEAIAIGMVAEARIAERIGVASAGLANAVRHACTAAGLPTAIPPLPLEEIIARTHSDKKARGGHVEYALPERVGLMAGADRGWSIPVSDDVVREVLAS